MAGDDRKGSADDKSSWAAAGQFSGFGLTWALSVLAFLGGGWWLDGRTGTTPLFTVLGALVGASAGFYSLWRHVMVEPKKRAERREADEDDAGGGAA